MNTGTVVELRGYTQRFGNKIAVDDLTLDVPRGTVFGFVGENGAGKTTTIKAMMGLLTPISGNVRVFGMNPIKETVPIMRRVGYMSENREMYDWLKVEEIIRLNASFYETSDLKLIKKLFDSFQLDAGAKVKSLSRGERARLALLMALGHRPDLLILDEPSSGLDPVVRMEILTSIVRTVADEGRTVFFSSHLLNEVERVADRVAMIHKGRLVMCDDLETLKSSHCKFHVRLPETVLVPDSTLPGVLYVAGVLPEFDVTCDGRREEFISHLQSVGGIVLDEVRPSLEEVFIAQVKVKQQQRV